MVCAACTAAAWHATDRATVSTSSEDGTVRLWDVEVAIERGDDALSLKEFYALAGWQLLAKGSLGSVTSDGETIVDDTKPAPKFAGLDKTLPNLSGSLFSMKLGTDGVVTADTELVSRLFTDSIKLLRCIRLPF